jgi:hypothetical protein
MHRSAQGLCIATMVPILGRLQWMSSTFCASHNIENLPIKQRVMRLASEIDDAAGSRVCTGAVRILTGFDGYFMVRCRRIFDKRHKILDRRKPATVMER